MTGDTLCGVCRVSCAVCRVTCGVPGVFELQQSSMFIGSLGQDPLLGWSMECLLFRMIPWWPGSLAGLA